ncbi:hypothetical protein T8K17_00130 [Thalassobaculum sp. OXR-137]|uniref:hypothetical protein n=1 Tax=Thalassobaculum sp. OXR-137 TaxID=3100173 RepID=UPI002AC8D514|nr:hypothetical protein [Thalassobaculum sp. OXR-137]WPZ34554.1 hypothetical protein T8K17_00130 [Thalassobaculum sp. OXR-137]
MSVTALFWIAMTCAGWLLVFRSGTPAVVVSETDAPADWAQTLAFVGSALSTVGASNAQASNTFWDNVAMVAAVNGMVVLTLSVTFVLNVTQTVVKGRGFAALVRSYDLNRGANDDVILPQLANLCFQLKAFPLAVYYSAERTESSIPHTMVWIAESLAHDPSRFERYRGFMKELSGLHVDRETNTAGFLDGLRNWAARSSLD